jgi:hypothetical protein
VLDAKGGENKGQSDKWISYHLRVFENNRIELLVCQNSFIVSLVKRWLLVGRSIDYGKKGESLKSWINFSWNDSLYVLTCVFDLEIEIWVWFAKNKPSGGKEWSIYAKNESKQIWVFICIDIALVLVALCCVGINHQKGGDWKGKCALGPFLSILVIECQRKCFCVDLCNEVDKVQIMSKGMFLRLSTLF